MVLLAAEPPASRIRPSPRSLLQACNSGLDGHDEGFEEQSVDRGPE